VAIVTPFVQVGTYPTRNFAQFVLTVSGQAGLYLGRPRFILLAMDRISSIPSLVR